MDRVEVTTYLRTVPDIIEEVLQGLSDDDFCCRPSPDEWSILEVCCHLRDYSRIEGQRVRRLVEEDEPALQAWDELQLARERQYAEDDPRRVRTALRAFWGVLAYQLEGLTDEQWERAGTHPEIGRVTVRSRADRQVKHARIHLEQLRAIRQTL
jgi:hypothetical protein